MTFQSQPPAGHQLETASAITLTFFFDLLSSFVFHSFNFICALPMSSDDAELVEQPDGAGYGRLAALITMAGPSESVLMRKFRTVCSCFREKVQEGSSGSCSVSQSPIQLVARVFEECSMSHQLELMSAV
jgi:hypothetical protein